MQSLNFVGQNARWLLAPMLMTFASGFGQTFFISIYAGEIRAEFGLSHSGWSAYYASGTLASALLMMFIGGLSDRLPARRITLAVLVLFILACLAMGNLPAVWALPVVIFGLRFCGQGMMSMLAMVFAGRWFTANRGKVVALASIGFTLAESLLPVIFVALMGVYGWRSTWVIAAAVLVPLGAILAVLIARERQPQAAATQTGPRQTGMGDQHWTRAMMLKNWVFWVGLPAFLVQPMLGTTFFFQQVHLTEVKGWALADFAALIPIYSASSLISMFAVGALADKIGVARLLPVYLLPMAGCFAIFSVTTDLGTASLAMVLFGVMQGAGNAVGGLFWPEFYGTRHLGSVRSLATATMVFASAIGPLGSGIMLDSGITYETQLVGMAVAVVLACGLLLIVALGSRNARR